MSGPELLEAFEAIKEVDGWTAGMQAFMEQYDLEPAQAIAWTRFLIANWGGLEADYLTTGPSEQLRVRVYGLMTFPDNQLFWETHGPVFDQAFITYVEGLLSDDNTR